VIACMILTACGIAVPDSLIKIFGALLGYGVVDKLRKAENATQELKDILTPLIKDAKTEVVAAQNKSDSVADPSAQIRG
jgi:hypothetical protein